MDLSAVRQPIFNTRKNKVAYQICFMNKGQLSNKCIPPSVFRDKSDPRKLYEVLSKAGLDHYADNKALIITFKRDTFKSIIDSFFSSRSLVIEISPHEMLDGELLALIRLGERNNYHLVMDERILSNGNEAYLKYVSHVKINVRDKTAHLLQSLVEKANSYNVRVIVDNISSHEEFNNYRSLKVDFFKGDLFSKQNVVDIRTNKLNEGLLLNVFQHVMSEDYCYTELTDILEADIQLTHKLITFLNDVMYGRNGTIYSIKQAVCFMGENNMRKFISLLTTQELTQTRPEDIYKKATSRARFCELLALRTGKTKSFIDRVFLAGLFSNLPEILGLDMEEALDMLKIHDEIKKALMGQECDLKNYVDIVIAFEQADWVELNQLTERSSISAELVSRLYNQMLFDMRNDSYLRG